MREIDNILDFKAYINKLDKIASTTDMSQPNTVFPQKNDSIQDKLNRFFSFADGNPEWNV